MTFPFNTHRPSSEDDALDQQLNAWASGSDPDPENGLATDALEFHRWADDTRRSDSAAMGPAAGTWNRVLRRTAQATPKGMTDMSTTTFNSYTEGVSVLPRESAKQSVRHYANLVATIALVLAVAVGGWLAMSQMPGGGTDNEYGMLFQSDQTAVCDVEPMTVDEVMEIVENPYRYMDVANYQTPRYGSTDHTPWLDEYAEVQPNVDSTIVLGAGDVPTQSAFDQSSEVISRYISCLQETPTVAMMLRFSDPFSIQSHIRMEFPFYRTEDDVREYVTTWLSMTDGYHSFTGLENNENHTYGQIDNRHGATTQVHDFGMGFDQVIYIGTEVYDENGEFLGIFQPMLNLTYGRDGKYLDRGVIFTLLHSRYTGEWYVVTDGWIFTGGK